MVSQPETSRFQVNPVEVLIFLGVCSFLTFSVYRLVFQEKNYEVRALASTTTRFSSESEHRSPIAANVLATLRLPCSQQGSLNTIASRVRLMGGFCQWTPETGKEITVRVANLTNHQDATLFIDSSRENYSTDYIPLEAGENRISVELQSPNRDSFRQSFVIQRQLEAF